MKTKINILNIIDNILKEDNSLQKIYFPTLNQPLKEEKPKGNYIFINGETFKGKIKDKIFQKGKYIWPNGQEFYGDLSPYNRFNKKGKIIFPNKDELTGIFNPENNLIEKAVYKTSTRLYQGTFKNNKLNGKFIIKNNENSPHYLFIGSYLNGIKDGKFSLETRYDNQKINMTGTFEKGKKNGNFIFKIEEEKIEVEFNDDFIKILNGIEKKNFFEKKEKNKICCMKIIEEIIENKKTINLLLGSYENLLIYYIDVDKKDINLKKTIHLFKNEDINDILKLKDGKLLLCSSRNNFKLIELLFEKNNSKINNKIENDFRIVQVFNGLNNSKNIFSLIELTNELIVSGDCENIILWKKMLKSENIPHEQNYELKIMNNKNLSHTYCILEIDNENSKIKLAVAQPDSKSIIFLQISSNYDIDEITSIKNIDTVSNRKNIMTIFKSNLLIGCKNQIIEIDLNKYKIINKIYIDSITFITYINSYLNDFLLLGLMRNKNSYNYEAYLSQRDYVKNETKAKIMSISDFKKRILNGNIIDVDIYSFNNDENNNNEIMVSISTDGKILLLF